MRPRIIAVLLLLLPPFFMTPVLFMTSALFMAPAFVRPALAHQVKEKAGKKIKKKADKKKNPAAKSPMLYPWRARKRRGW